MSEHEVHVRFPGKIVFVGFGSIGQGILPLILRHIGTSSDRITIVTAEDRGRAEAEEFGVAFVKSALTRGNFRQVLEPLLGNGDFLLNLSVDVSSIDLIRLARERGALYLDTCIEPWAGGYVDPALSVEGRSNYAMRLAALARDARCAGVVCSPHEARDLKAYFGADFKVLCPGIRPAGAAHGDQKRGATPQSAVEAGADYLVVGRPIVGAADPVAAARAILDEMDLAARDR